MISPVGNDPLPRSQAQQSDELTPILQGHSSDERAIGLGELVPGCDSRRTLAEAPPPADRSVEHRSVGA
jgi:hypothetical protein